MYDYVWLCMAMYDYEWLYMTIIDYVHMPFYDNIWLSITMNDYVWLNMTMYDHLWLYTTMYDHVWLHMSEIVELMQLWTNFVLVSWTCVGWFRMFQNGSNDFKKLKKSSLFSNYA